MGTAEHHDRAGRARILVVEDELGDAQLIRKALQQWPVAVDVRVAGDGEEALRLLCGAHGGLPDLVLLDLNSPDQGGIDLLGRIRASRR